MASGGWHRLGGVNQVKGGRTGFVRQPSLMPGKLSWQHQLEFAREPEPIGWINTHTYMHTRTHVESTNVKIVTATAGEEPSSLLSLWGWVAQNTYYARSSHLSPREQQLSICLACEAGYLNSHNLVPQTLRVPGELWVLSSWGRTGKAGSDVLDQVLNSNNRVYQLSSQREGRGSKRRSPVVHVFIGTATRPGELGLHINEGNQNVMMLSLPCQMMVICGKLTIKPITITFFFSLRIVFFFSLCSHDT